MEHRQAIAIFLVCCTSAAWAGQHWPKYERLRTKARGTFPVAESVLLKARDDQDVQEVRKHAWDLFAGLTRSVKGNPVWQTWYTKCDARLADCGEGSNKEPDSGRILRSLEIPEQWLIQLRQEMDSARELHHADATKKDTSDVILQGFKADYERHPVFASVFFDEEARSHIVDNTLYDQTALKSIKIQRLDSHAIRSEREIPPFPARSVVLKAVWELVILRPDGFTAPLFVWNRRTQEEKEGIQGYQLGSTEDWGNPIRIDVNPHHKCQDGRVYQDTAPLGCFFAFKIKCNEDLSQTIKIGNCGSPKATYYLVLMGMHVMTKEASDWDWATFWWSNDPSDKDYGLDKPPQSILKGSQWRHFLMNTTLSRRTPLERPPHPQGPKICFNPYLEPMHPNGLVSNCMQCHRRAVYSDDPSKALEGQSLGLTWRDGKTPPNGTPRDPYYFTDTLRTDYLWSIATVKNTDVQDLEKMLLPLTINLQ